MLLRTGPHHQLTCGHVAAKFNFYTRYDEINKKTKTNCDYEVLAEFSLTMNAVQYSGGLFNRRVWYLKDKSKIT